MKSNNIFKESSIIILSALILAVSVSMFDFSLFTTALISFLVIIAANIITKKVYAYYLEANVKTRFWSWYHYWFRADTHFIKPLPMVWLPPIVSFMSLGNFQWLGILGFDVEARTERVSKRHGLYRFTEMTEWHIASIVISGLVANIILAILGYITGFGTFARLNIYYAAWSIIPIGGLDGSKLFFGSKSLWITFLIIITTILVYSMIVI